MLYGLGAYSWLYICLVLMCTTLLAPASASSKNKEQPTVHAALSVLLQFSGGIIDQFVEGCGSKKADLFAADARVRRTPPPRLS